MVFSLYKILPSEELVEVVAEVTEVALEAVAALEAGAEVVTGGGLDVIAVEGLGVPSEDLFSLESCCCLEGVVEVFYYGKKTIFELCLHVSKSQHFFSILILIVIIH